MRNQISQHGNWFENLENRRLLSASADGLVLDALSAQQAFVMSPMVTTPNIVGTFTGTTTDANAGDVGNTTDVITGQTHTNHLIGTISTKFPHEHTQVNSFTGKISGKSFTLTLNDGTSVKGSATDHGHDLSGSWTKGNDHGTFSVSR